MAAERLCFGSDKCMKTLKVIIPVMVLVLVLSSCLFIPPKPPVQHGRIVSVSEPQTMTKATLKVLLSLAGVDMDLLYDVHAYKLVYETVGPHHKKSIQSGLMLLPATDEMSARAPLEVPILSLQHGTIFSRALSPSNFDAESILTDNPEDLTGIIAAGLGFATVMPDYAGFGTDTTTFHPFCDEYSISYSVLDMIRAGKTYLQQHASNYTWSSKLFLAGYSEGGYATMAASKLIQNNSEFTITGTAPMAGPYNMSTVMKGIVTDDNVYDHLEFLSYMIFGYYEVYGLFSSPSQILLEPYATQLPPLFDGEHTSADVRGALPDSGVGKASEIFTQYLFDQLNLSTSDANAKLKSNDLYNTWVPEVPILMIHSATDEAVPVENSRTAVAYFESQGATVNYIELPRGKHVESYIPAFLLAIGWLRTLNQ